MLLTSYARELLTSTERQSTNTDIGDLLMVSNTKEPKGYYVYLLDLQ
jgi:hypothetical protein